MLAFWWLHNSWFLSTISHDSVYIHLYKQ